jgi:hypothetical protein
MDNEKTFKTTTGFCHILPERIVLTRDGITGNIAAVTVGINISRIFIIYGGISAGLFFYAFDYYKSGQIYLPILFGLLGLYLIYGILNSINNSATPIIDRNKIRDIKFKKAFIGLTRSHFEVIFEDEKGKSKRLIMLPANDGQMK